MTVKVEHCIESSKKEHLSSPSSKKNRYILRLLVHGKIYISLFQVNDVVHLGKQSVIAVAGAIHYVSTYLDRMFAGGTLWVWNGWQMNLY